MAPRLKQDYPALMAEYDQRISAGETPQAIKASFQERGIHWGTFQNHRTHAKKKVPRETPISVDDTPVEVLPGQMSIEDADTVPPHEALLTIGNNLPVVSEHDGPLSTDETGVLDYYERIIEKGVQTFVEVGHALAAIRDQRLYRERYSTFDAYVRERWELERTYAHRIIEASEVVDRLLPVGNMVPVNESQARPLTSLSPAQQVEVWKEVVETAPAGKVTAQHVKDTVKRATATGTTPPKTIGPKPPKPFDVHGITTKIKDLYMDWLKHCETDDALETAQFFLNTLSDLAQGRAMLLHRQ